MTGSIDIPEAIAGIKALVGAKGFIADAAGMAPFLEEERGLYRGAARLVVRPASTEEVAGVVRLCAAAHLPIVPQGGNTGLVGAAVPPEDGSAVLLSLGRLNRVRA
ncbi:MAG TPA: FAD-binding protein, partial [Stellaceae bacterium]|nr:FAD-binding protein [Stellaceae bacterium]